MAENQFIGRDKDFAHFRRWLNTTYSWEPSVLFFYDLFDEAEKKGGIGKSWLLNKYALEVSSHPDSVVVRVDFFSILDRDGVEIALRVVEAVKAAYPDWKPETFEREYTRYRLNLQRGRTGLHLPVLRAALVDDLAQLQKQFHDRRKHIIVFCDTYERVELHPEQISLSSDHPFPDTYDSPLIGFVIAGRNEPSLDSSNWRTQSVDKIAVQPFTLAEMNDYIDMNIGIGGVAPLEPATSQKLYEKTDGRPILIGLMTDALTSGALTIRELLKHEDKNFEKFLVEQINTPESIHQAVLGMAHIYHRFNKAILRYLYSLIGAPTDAETIDRTWEELRRHSYIRKSVTGEDIALHDEMRRLVLRWIWKSQTGPDGPFQQELSQYMIVYYEKMIASEQHVPLRQAYQTEMLYHLLFLDKERGFAYFLEQVQSALSRQQNIFARSLIQEVHGFVLSQQQSTDKQDASDSVLSREQMDSLDEQEATLLHHEEKYAEALKQLDKLLAVKDAEWLKQHEPGLLHERGICLTQLRRFREAIRPLTRSLEMYEARKDNKRLAVVYGNIGNAYDKQGNLKTAIRHYGRSIELHSRAENGVGAANILTVLAVAYAKQGKLDEALRYGDRALKLRWRLYDEQWVGELSLAFSMRALGMVHLQRKEVIQAKNYLDQAYEIFERCAYQRGIASTYNEFGQLALYRGAEFRKGSEPHKAAVREAEDWFARSIRLAHNFDAEIEVKSIYKQSQVFVQKEEIQEAIVQLGIAIEKAAEISDLYQQAEALVEYAKLLFLLERFNEAEQAFAQAGAIAIQEEYFALLGAIEKFHGDTFYKDGSYPEAFQSYVRYCYFMARYNQTEYHEAVRQTSGSLIDLPKDWRSQIWQQLRDDWSAINLEEEQHRYMEHVLEEDQRFLSL